MMTTPPKANPLQAARPILVRAAACVVSFMAVSCAPAGSATYYVDWDKGDDSRAGTTTESAWKHAPGDAAASGRAGSATLHPGDRVIFRAGVGYRGTILNRWSGTAEKPIIFTGLGWGEGMGIIDGSDPVASVAPCKSAADCGGAPGWQNLAKIRFTQPTQTKGVYLFGSTGPYWRSQYPAPDDPFYADKTNRYVVIPVADMGDLERGYVRDEQIVRAANGGGGMMELGVWNLGNDIRYSLLTAVRPDMIEFSTEEQRILTTREGKVALLDSFAGLTGPGTFLTLEPGVVLAWLRPEDTVATLSVGAGRSGIDFKGTSHLRIDGLHFRNFSGAQRDGRAGNTAIRNRTKTSVDVQIRGSLIGPAVMAHGGGVIQLAYTEGFQLLSSRVESIQFGSGVRTGPKNRDIHVAGNVFRGLGRTAITLLSVDGAKVSGNFLTDIRGIHGNAMTAYLANRNIDIGGNCVVNAARPLTFHGNKTPDIRNDITIHDNILIATEDGQAAIISWGRGTYGVTIRNNLALGNKLGMLTSRGDRDFVIANNISNRIGLHGADVPADWKLSGNQEMLTRTQVIPGTYNEDGCEISVVGRTFRTTRLPR